MEGSEASMSFLNKLFGGKQMTSCEAQKRFGTKISRPKVSKNPAVQACDLDHYIASRLHQERSLDLHSAFQLQFESIRIGSNAYSQHAWGHKLYTRQLYELFMLCLTARALGCSDQMKTAE